jgi:hypothetical protein
VRLIKYFNSYRLLWNAVFKLSFMTPIPSVLAWNGMSLNSFQYSAI